MRKTPIISLPIMGEQTPLEAPAIETISNMTGRRQRSDKGKARGPRGSSSKSKASGYVSDADVEKLHAFVCLIIGSLSILLAEQVRPSQEEIDLIFQPAERIVLRRLDVSDKITPDMADGLQCLTGIILYSVRVAQYVRIPKRPANVTQFRQPSGTQSAKTQRDDTRADERGSQPSRPTASLETLLPHLHSSIQQNPSAGITIVPRGSDTESNGD